MTMIPSPYRRHSAARLLGRWLSGRPMSGHRRTDSTFLRPATVVVLPGQLAANRWDNMAGWRRSAWRQTALVGPLAVLWQYAGHPTRTVALGAAGAACGLAVAARRTVRRWPDRRHVRAVVQPMHRVLSADLGLPHNVRPDDYLTVPATYADSETTPIVVRLPAAWAPTKAAQDRTAALVLAKSGQTADTADCEWTTRGGPTLIVRKAPAAPDVVRWADVVGDVETSRPGDLVLGAGPRGALYRWDLNTEDPHAGFSVGSGRGKSSLLQVIAAQVIRPGGRVTAVDPKMTSFEDIAGVPGLDLANDPGDVQAMWDAVAGVRGEMERRRAERDADPTAEWPVRMLMVDEVNQFSAQSAAHWRNTREPTDGPVPPVWDDIAAVAWMGRAFSCHLVIVGQRLDARATGGNGLRDSFGLRGLAGYTAQQWRMLGPGGKMPTPQKPRGRWLYLSGGEQAWVQNVLAAPGELRAWLPARGCPMSQVDASAQVNTPHGTRWVVGLDAAAAHLGVGVEAFRKARYRAGGTLPGERRDGNQPAFPADALDALAVSPEPADRRDG
jgi:hypothetical protein